LVKERRRLGQKDSAGGMKRSSFLRNYILDKGFGLLAEGTKTSITKTSTLLAVGESNRLDVALHEGGNATFSVRSTQ